MLDFDGIRFRNPRIFRFVAAHGGVLRVHTRLFGRKMLHSASLESPLWFGFVVGGGEPCEFSFCRCTMGTLLEYEGREAKKVAHCGVDRDAANARFAGTGVKLSGRDGAMARDTFVLIYIYDE